MKGKKPMANFEGTKFNYHTIEPSGGGGWDVYGHGVYERGSVLAGRAKRAYRESFDTLEEARADYPDARNLDHSTRIHTGGGSLADLSGLPSSAPGWFDEGAAGERWDED
jgi:hypothetical protein